MTPVDPELQRRSVLSGHSVLSVLSVLSAGAARTTSALHLGHAGTLTGLPRVLDAPSARHLRAVTMTELLGEAA